MGPRIPLWRKAERKSQDGRHRMTHGAQAVTHRSPVGDDFELPCCGRPLSGVREPDRITSDPSEVTCRG
jgi:hypothetical protein